MRQVGAGETIIGRILCDIDDHPVPVPDSERIVHLQFRRDAGCPVCHVHLRTFVVRHDELDCGAPARGSPANNGALIDVPHRRRGFTP